MATMSNIGESVKFEYEYATSYVEDAGFSKDSFLSAVVTAM